MINIRIKSFIKIFVRLQFCLILLVTMLLCGCSERNQTRRIITEMIGKQVVLPDSLNLINGNQMEDSEILSLDGKSKVIFFIDSLECSACKISDLHLADTLFKLFPSSILVPMVIVNPQKSKRDEILSTLYYRWLGFPIYDDVNSKFMEYNSFVPKNSKFHVVLVDSENIIKLVGNPAYNASIMELYVETLKNLDN